MLQKKHCKIYWAVLDMTQSELLIVKRGKNTPAVITGMPDIFCF